MMYSLVSVIFLIKLLQYMTTIMLLQYLWIKTTGLKIDAKEFYEYTILGTYANEITLDL